jgi:bacterioferritin
MQGDPEVIKLLNDVLCAELTGINQYFIHAMMCANWRYNRLAEHSRKESIEEMKHAQEVIERILYLDGVPNMQKYMKINVGQTVPEQHQFDLALEKDAVARLNPGTELCRAKGDNGSRLLLESILKDEEEHVDWLESQLQQIQEMGLPNYLAQQIEEED